MSAGTCRARYRDTASAVSAASAASAASAKAPPALGSRRNDLRQSMVLPCHAKDRESEWKCFKRQQFYGHIVYKSTGIYHNWLVLWNHGLV